MSLKMRILRAKVKAKKRKEEGEEEGTLKAEIRARRAKAESERRAAISERKEAASRKKREAEALVRQRTTAEREELTAGREEKRARLMTERELRRERIKPYTEALTKVAKGVEATGKLAYRGIKKLGEMGAAQPRTPQSRKGSVSPGVPLDTTIDFGFPKRGGPESKRKPYVEPPLDIRIDIK